MTRLLKTLDLFSGIGGFSLGLRMAGGFRTVQFCEINRNCWPTLERHFPGVPIHDDVRTLHLDHPVDVVVGGFPCQDISVAGKGAGIDGERSGLWSEMHRLVRALRPRWVVAENVPALRTRGADRVLADLEGAGYAVWPLVVGADDVGAPHRRKRVWIVAHAERARLEGQWHGAGRTGSQVSMPAGGCASGWPARPGEQQHDWEAPRLVRADIDSLRQQRERSGRGWSSAEEPRGSSPRLADPDRRPRHGLGNERDEGDQRGDGHAGREEELPGQPEPGVGGTAHGLPPRLVRAWRREALAAYGNAVVPQVLEQIGRAILKANETHHV